MPATLRHHARRFWQGSPDHRGVPESPGRVVTLAPMKGTHCQGVVFGITAERFDDVIQYLDVRESGGYERTVQSIKLHDGRTIDAIVYVGRPANPSYLGSAPSDEMARHIATSVGPSGPNLDYLLELRAALHELNCRDKHIEDIIAHLPEEMVK